MTSSEIVAARFTLRKEYFGGLVYDAKTARVELLDPADYSLLAGLKAGSRLSVEKAISLYSGSVERINALFRTGLLEEDLAGYLSMPSTRQIEPPSDLRPGMLTAPIRVFDSYTRRCNLACAHCYFSSSAHVKEGRRTIEQTAEILRKFYEVGTMEWRFTGGEAVTAPDLFDAIQIAIRYGMNVGLYSNGCWTEAIAGKVLGSGLAEIIISLEGREATNDQRRKKGVYRRVIETLERISEYNHLYPHRAVKASIAAAVGRDNVSDVEFLVRLAAKYSFDVVFMPLKPSGRARSTLASAMMTTREFMEFSRTVQRLREDPDVMNSGIRIVHKYKDLFCPSYPDASALPFPFNYSECAALTTALSLLPDGRVYACPFVLENDPEGQYMGPDITLASVKEAWQHPNFVRFREAEKVRCKECAYYMRQCRGFCRATVLGSGGKIEDGKLMGRDPYCYAALMEQTPGSAKHADWIGKTSRANNTSK